MCVSTTVISCGSPFAGPADDPGSPRSGLRAATWMPGQPLVELRGGRHLARHEAELVVAAGPPAPRPRGRAPRGRASRRTPRARTRAAAPGPRRTACRPRISITWASFVALLLRVGRDHGWLHAGRLGARRFPRPREESFMQEDVRAALAMSLDHNSYLRAGSSDVTGREPKWRISWRRIHDDTLGRRPSGPVAGAAAPARPQQPPSFEATRELVRIDVVALDGDGRPVRGLTADDFEIARRDGSCRSPASRRSSSPRRAARAPARAGVVGAGAGRARRSNRAFVVLFDDVNLSLRSAYRVQTDLAKFLPPAAAKATSSRWSRRPAACATRARTAERAPAAWPWRSRGLRRRADGRRLRRGDGRTASTARAGAKRRPTQGEGALGGRRWRRSWRSRASAAASR